MAEFERPDASQMSEELSSANAIIEAISWEFHTVWVVDKETTKMKLVRSIWKDVEYDEAMDMISQFETWDGPNEKYIRSYIVKEDQERVRRETSSAAIIKRLETTDRFIVNFRLQMIGGEVSYQQMVFANADTEGGRRRFVAGFRSVDDVVTEKDKRQRELEEAKAEAEKANSAKTAFLFNMSHDIRTPMNAIVGYAEMAQRHEDDPEIIHESLHRIAVASEQLLGLINDILDMSKIENGKIELSKDIVSLSAVGENLKSIFSSQAKAKNIELSVDMSGLEHFDVSADRRLLGRILMNLISNSIKFTNEYGRVELNISEKPSADETAESAEYTFTITDNGIGMSEEFLKKIFAPFERERTSTVSQQQGTGLGMSIVKNLVGLMGGNISIESEPGKGSSFAIRLPLEFAHVEVGQYSTLSGHVNNSFAGKKVLLVEDIDVNRDLAKMILTEKGIIVDEAINGKEAVEKYSENTHKYDAILMDVQMPVMNGYDATRAIRRMEHSSASAVPIIAMTANAFTEDKLAAIEAGMNAHLSKPIDTKQLFRTLSAYM